jgi:hypothetical protein
MARWRCHTFCIDVAKLREDNLKVNLEGGEHKIDNLLEGLPRSEPAYEIQKIPRLCAGEPTC